MEFPSVGERITVRGLSGSGKSTLARQLGEVLDLPHIELDSLYWQPNWHASTDQEFLPLVEEAARKPRWVICGNYSRCRHIVDPLADTMIWLDYPFLFVLMRLLRRCVIRSRSKDLLWGHSQETLWNAFFGKNAIVWWIFRVRARQRRQLEAMFASPIHGKTYIRLRSHDEAQRLIEDLRAKRHQS
jgi:adenylate kinase family enzyme